MFDRLLTYEKEHIDLLTPSLSQRGKTTASGSMCKSVEGNCTLRHTVPLATRTALLRDAEKISFAGRVPFFNANQQHEWCEHGLPSHLGHYTHGGDGVLALAEQR